MRSTRMIISLSTHMRKLLEELAKKRGCSQAEVLRNGILIQDREEKR